MPSSCFTGFYVIAPHFVPCGGQTSFPTSPSETWPPLFPVPEYGAQRPHGMHEKARCQKMDTPRVKSWPAAAN
jgi:hypothetical protein